MNLDELSAADPFAVATLAGLTPKPPQRKQAGLYVSPCPLCGATTAHSRNKGGRPDQRGPVHIRDGFACYACPGRGSRADLIALARWRCRWSQTTPEQRAMVMDAPTPAPCPSDPPLPYLSPETWERLAAACIPAHQDRDCVAWAERRRLPLAPDLLAIVGTPDEALPLWTSKGGWLPDFGSKLLLPLSDHHGRIAGARVRSVRPDPLIKEQALRGLSAQGLVYAPYSVRSYWQAGEPYPGPWTLLEGKPDQLAAWGAWGRERACLGFLEGSFAKGAPWLARLSGEGVMVYQEDAPDKHGRRKGVTFAERAALLRPGLRCVGVSAAYAAAGAPWSDGMDLGDLAGRIPPWSAIPSGA